MFLFCSCFVLFWFVLCLFCVCLCLLLSVSCENHSFLCNSSVLVYWRVNLGSHSSFWFLLVVCVWFAFVSRCSFGFVLLLVLLFVWITIITIVLDVFLHCIFFCCWCLFLLWYFVCVFLIFGYLPKTYLEKLEIPKTPKMKKAEKTDILTRAASTGVLTNSVFFCFGVSLEFACFAENTIKLWFQQKTTKKQKFLCLKLVQGCVKNWSKYVAQQNWTSFQHNFLVIFCVTFVFEYPLFLQGERDFQKQTKQKTPKNWTSSQHKKGKNWTTASIER